MPMQPEPGQVPQNIQNQMPLPRQSSPEENPEGAPTDILAELQKALFQANQAIQGSGLPKEGQMHLAKALAEYSSFIKIVGSSMGVPMPEVGGEGMTMGNQPEAIGGQKGAMPADQPVGRNVRPMPA